MILVTSLPFLRNRVVAMMDVAVMFRIMERACGEHGSG
jgi:hypothetical protein